MVRQFHQAQHTQIGTPGIITVDKTTGKVTVAIPSDKNPGDE